MCNVTKFHFCRDSYYPSSLLILSSADNLNFLIDLSDYKNKLCNLKLTFKIQFFLT